MHLHFIKLQYFDARVNQYLFLKATKPAFVFE